MVSIITRLTSIIKSRYITFVLLGIIILQHILYKQKLIEVNLKVCDTFYSPSTTTTNYEGDYGGPLYPGQRIWHRISPNMWIELYDPTNMKIFHLFVKRKKITLDKCDGEVLQRVNIQQVGGQDRMYSYTLPTSNQQTEIFMPDQIKCCQLKSGHENVAWHDVYPLHK